MSYRVNSCSQVDLFHYQDLSFEALDLENAVQQEVLSVASCLGLESKVYKYWGLTLYHPDDMPLQGIGALRRVY